MGLFGLAVPHPDRLAPLWALPPAFPFVLQLLRPPRVIILTVAVVVVNGMVNVAFLGLGPARLLLR